MIEIKDCSCREEFLYRNFPIELIKENIKRKVEIFSIISDFRDENIFRNIK